jgi:chromosome segregation ATPase
MDSELTLDRVQNLLLGMEGRANARFDRVEQRLSSVEGSLSSVEGSLRSVEGRLSSVEGRLSSVEGKIDSVARELTLNNELLAPFIRWSHRVEDEVIRLSSELQAVQARLAKLENPPVS